jgi:hypothetical protein
MKKHQREEILSLADTLRKAEKDYNKMVVPDYSVNPKTQWEYYCDTSYYHMWAVRDVRKRGFDDAIHVKTMEEAKFICDKFNELESLK